MEWLRSWLRFKTIAVMVMAMVMAFLSANAWSGPLGLSPIIYKSDDIVEEDIIGLSPADWSKLIKEVEDLREINKLLNQKSEYMDQKSIQQTGIITLKDQIITEYEQQCDIQDEKIKTYSDELDECQSRVLSIVKWNSYKTGFTFVLGISTAVLAGWAFSEIAK